MMTPAVAAALIDAAAALFHAAESWGSGDQAAFDESKTQIARAFGMSIDEAAAEIYAFVEEATTTREETT